MTILLRSATRDDYELLMAWRSDPEIYQGFYSQGKSLVWEEHIKWMESRNQDWRTFIVVYNGRRVGVVTVGQLDHWNPEIGYYIGEKSLWGHGVGKEVVQAALDWLRNRGYKYCHTTVLKTNKRSVRLLENLGFETGIDARPGEVWYHKNML